MGRLLLLFIAVPIAELVLLIEIGERIGTLATVVLILSTGIIGASLARQQGLSVVARLRADLDQGRMPADALVDGVLILLAGAVLITPGVLTDILGFFCLVPACRRWLKRVLTQRFQRAVRAGEVNVVSVSVDDPAYSSRQVKNVTPGRRRES